MTIYQSYTYYISWSKHNVSYYGVRMANKCLPGDDLWKKYFTSSKEVTKYRNNYGEPDIITIDKTFEKREDARNYEFKFLNENDCVRSDEWLNKAAFPVFDNTGRKRPEHSKRMMGKNNPNYGKPISDEQKKKISVANTGKKRSAAVCKKMSEDRAGNRGGKNNGFYGKTHSQELKDNISRIHKGKVVSEETKKKMSESQKKIKRIKTTCPHCGKIGAARSMTRYHFDNCSSILVNP